MSGKATPNPTRAAVARPFTTPAGGFVDMDGESYYRISAYHRLAPFLMSIPSHTDLWMFLASSGGLTAGRVDAEGSLFPYRTADQLYDDHHHTGPLTLVRVARNSAEPALWEPFCEADAENLLVERNLFKNVEGNRVVFEEVHHGLGLAFRYRWAACDAFGWVRTATLENHGPDPVRVDVLDGLRNILPHGAPLALQQQSSNLVDAYKTSEIDPDTGLGVFALTAGITDRAEAIEVLRANTVWSHGLPDCRIHLSLNAVAAFRNGRVLSHDRVLHGARGNYLTSSSHGLDPEESRTWHIVGDVGRDHLQVADLRRMIRDDEGLGERITRRLSLARESLRRNVGSADGIQLSGRPESWSHHFANVLFNNMRGGVFDRNHMVATDDVTRFLRTRNTEVADRWASLLADLPEDIGVAELKRVGLESGDPDFARLCHEYLPLYFGRRHGDPSRPWNRFSVRVRNADGERELNYEGNWRDIFQNWEALGTAFPGFLTGMVATFVDASTVDGFNPYRITREGVDWETVIPDDPWSNIGYWGDHQIVYLLRLLEMLDRHNPEGAAPLLGEAIFSYADVPYRIKPYQDVLRDPGDTIDFDEQSAEAIDDRVARLGGDGKLLTGSDGAVVHVNLLEKLLVPLLSKLSNLIPDAGIWMNTQRPEWNDANNVLGGGGVSVVTLCHLRRYLAHLSQLIEAEERDELPVSKEVVDWLDCVAAVFTDEAHLLSSERIDAADRRRLMDALGVAFSDYRGRVYDHGFSGAEALPLHRVADLCDAALAFVDRGIDANRRDDGLYHSYNLLNIADDGGVEVVRLEEMLEGQVAALSSGLLDPDAALDVVDRLFASDMYRPDQRSFTLYPERDVAGFLARNRVPEAEAEAVPLVAELLRSDDGSLLARDADGVLRFHRDFRNARDVAAALDRLGERAELADAAARDRTAVLDLFEGVFHHKSYTGRSGVMYAYEGQGSIYWHMVAKLLLALQEIMIEADRTGAPSGTMDRLIASYFRIRSGIGYEKTASEYGAFPIDPYSHTPATGGAKQPGTTGQVKEEILTRRGELGIRIINGGIRFRPLLLSADEYLAEPSRFDCYDVEGSPRVYDVPADGLAFTLCQTPVIYQLVDGETRIHIRLADGSTDLGIGDRLDASLSSDVFARNGRIDHILVEIPRSTLVEHIGPAAEQRS